MHPAIRNAASAATALVIAGWLTGCGGSDDAQPVVVPTTTRISGVAADGALQGATACYDLNDNNACDPGEPASAALTDANGAFSFEVANADAGRHRVVVDVPASAIDKDTGVAVGTAFKLVAPATGSASQAVFASPLTTLVQAYMDASGATRSAASDFIKAQASLAFSPLDDFTAVASADSRQAATVARLLLLTEREQARVLAPLVGQTPLDGALISQAEVNKAVQAAVFALLPAVAATTSDPAIAAAAASLQAALVAAAPGVVANAGVSAQNAATALAIAKLPPDTTAPATGASAGLTALRYTDANNWFYLTVEASAADNLADAAGRVRFYSSYKQSDSSGFSVNGVAYGWGAGYPRERAGDLHWNGSAWVGCPLGFRSSATVRDAQGKSSYDYCDKLEEGSSLRSAVDLAGKSIADVFRDTIRTFPGGAGGVNYADWGPRVRIGIAYDIYFLQFAAAEPDPVLRDALVRQFLQAHGIDPNTPIFGGPDLSVFGTAVFPAGALLHYQSSTVTKTAPAYDVRPVSAVNAYSAAIAVGGDARSNPGVACADTGITPTAVSTLEDMAARYPGKPCIFAKGTNADGASLDPNEWWSQSTIALGTAAGTQTLPAGTANYYTSNGWLRVGFAASGNGVTYYHCLQRKLDGSTRNCVAIGSGTFTIQTLGDARVMSFNAQPALAQKLGYVRVFVERGGKVYYGSTGQLGTGNSLRLNLEATNAVFEPLGLPSVRPVARPADFSAATASAFATAKGVYGLNNGDYAAVIRFGDAGRYLLAYADTFDPFLREQSGAELGQLDLDTATGRFAASIEVDSNLTAGASHDVRSGETLAISPDALTINNFKGNDTYPRLPGGTTGVVGLWAVGSATDLSVVHLAFFDNGRVMLIDSTGNTRGGACTIARQGPPGVELASYDFVAALGVLTVFNKAYDTNGCRGFFDSSAGAVASGTANTQFSAILSFAADGKTLVATIPGEPELTLYRIPSR